MSGRGRNTRSSLICDECNRYFLNKEALDSHKTKFHLTKKAPVATKNTANTPTVDVKSSKTKSAVVILTKVTSPVPEDVSNTVKKLIAASKNTPAKRNSSSVVSPVIRNVVQNEHSRNSSPQNGKPLNEVQIVSELSSKQLESVPYPNLPKNHTGKLKNRPIAVSFRNVGFKCPVCHGQFSSYFVSLKHIEKQHCTMAPGKIDNELIEQLKPVRMGQCTSCNEYFTISKTHTCPPVAVNMETEHEELIISTNAKKKLKNNTLIIQHQESDPSTNTTEKVKTYTNPKKSAKSKENNTELSLQVNKFNNKINTSVDPIALSEEDEVDPSKLMYVKKNSEFKCWGCKKTFINFDGFNSHVLQYHYEDSEVFFINNTNDFQTFSALIKKRTNATYKMLEISSQIPGNVFLQCQSRPLIDKDGVAYYCPSSLILQKFGHVNLVAYCKKHYCPSGNLLEISNAEALLETEVDDLYLQFQLIMNSIIIEAAKTRENKLKALNERAVTLAKYLFKINIDERKEPIRTSCPNIVQGPSLDEITVYKEDSKTTKRRYNKRLAPINDSKPTPVKRKKSTAFFENREDSPVHETVTTEVTIENHTPKIINTYSLKIDSPTISVKSVESLNNIIIENDKPVVNKKIEPETPASFSDTYKHFLKSGLCLLPEKTKLVPDKTKIRTKLGQFSPKNKSKTNDEPPSKKGKKKVTEKEKPTEKPKAKQAEAKLTEKPKAKQTEEKLTEKPKAKQTEEKLTEKPKAKQKEEKLTEKLKAKQAEEKPTEKSKAKSEKVGFESDKKTVRFSLTLNATKPKFVAKKALAPKTNVMSPKSSESSPKPSVLVKKTASPVVPSPKVTKYEVKEQENDCNILILKF